MSKMIAVCGAPSVGKTTAALKMAQEIYHSGKTSVLFLSPDLSVPCMAYLFPNSKDSELYSVGVALDKTDIYKEDVISQIVNVKTMRNFGFLGFKLGENKYSYPRPTEDKVVSFYRMMNECAEYIVVDCTGDTDDLISSVAKRDCDVAVQMFSADLKCMAYYASCVNEFLQIEGKKLKVMNCLDTDLYLPTGEITSHFGGMDFSLPYERALKQQMITGTLSERLINCKYRNEIEKLAKAVL